MTRPLSLWLDRVEATRGPLLRVSAVLIRWAAFNAQRHPLASALACALGVFLMRLDRALWSAFRV